MSVITETCLYYLTVDYRDRDTIYVFLSEDPGSDYEREEVTLQLLTHHHQRRFGPPILGVRLDGGTYYRQFPHLQALIEAGWTPVPKYRICDNIYEYFCPWAEPETDSIHDDMTRGAEATEV